MGGCHFVTPANAVNYFNWFTELNKHSACADNVYENEHYCVSILSLKFY